ncbi:MAG: hypothetical protein ACTSWL_06840 [Promethearchaeota archaeon]
MTICPSCGKAELTELVPGVMTCPACRKMFRGEIKEEIKKEEKTGIQDGKFFMDNTGINAKWEIADLGMTVAKEQDKSWIAVLLCHSPDFPKYKYMRISWWKKSVNVHAGMFRIDDIDEVDNVIISLKRFEVLFDDYFSLKDETKINYKPIPERANVPDIKDIFDIKKRFCPKCGYKMKKSRNVHYFECERCGEIIVMYEGKPIIEYPVETLPLSYSKNYPVNFYIPDYGITTKLSMADWKAIIIIYAKENPEKKWLRFYWWQRNLQSYMNSKYSVGNSQGLKWETKKGVMSPNIYEKAHIKKLIEALELVKKEWAKIKGIEVKEVDYVEGRKLSQEKISEPKIKAPTSKKTPTIRSKKPVMVEWIMEKATKNEYNKSVLVRKTKVELLKIIQNL